MILTGRQVREGRALAGLSQDELATAADVAVGLVVRIEGVDGMALARKPDLTSIRGALEAASVEFTATSGGSAGVRLRRPGLPSIEKP